MYVSLKTFTHFEMSGIICFSSGVPLMYACTLFDPYKF